MYSAANPSLASQLSNSAQVWRLPYWDWGLDSSIPDEWSATTINVWATDGGVTAVANPLNNYAFHPIDGSFSDEFIVWPKTLRQPTHNGWDAKSHPEIANQELAAAQLDRLILDIFPRDKFFVDPWGSFSDHEWKVTSPIEGYRTSLEDVHDKVHEAIGGLGYGIHVDGGLRSYLLPPSCPSRQTSLSLAGGQSKSLCVSRSRLRRLHPLMRPLLTKGSFIRKVDHSLVTVDENSPLHPFMKSETEFFTSKDVRSTGTFEYTYPDISSAGNMSPDRLSGYLLATVRSLYGARDQEEGSAVELIRF